MHVFYCCSSNFEKRTSNKTTTLIKVCISCSWHHAFSWLVIFSCSLLRCLEHEQKRDEGAKSLTSIDLIFLVNGYWHLFVVFHVFSWEDSPHEVDGEVGGTWNAEDLTRGAEIVVDVAVVEDVHTADEHVDEGSAFVHKLSNWWSLTLTLFFKASVVGSGVFALCCERVVHSLILSECLEAFRIFVSFRILGVEEHVLKELEGHKVANIDKQVANSGNILDCLPIGGEGNLIQNSDWVSKRI